MLILCRDLNDNTLLKLINVTKFSNLDAIFYTHFHSSDAQMCPVLEDVWAGDLPELVQGVPNVIVPEVKFKNIRE